MNAASPRPNVCIVAGTGSIGSRHLRLLRQRVDTQVLAFPVRLGRRQALTADGIPVIGSWDEARDAGATHAIVATSTARHVDDVVHALEVGCQVLVEKPMAADATDARAESAAAVRAATGLWVGCCLRFQAALGAFCDRLPAIGAVHSVRVECQSYLPDWRPGREYAQSYSALADSGGVLRDLIHEIDYSGWLFGWPSQMTAQLGNSGRLGIAAEETADLLWTTPSGTSISIRLDYLTRPPRRRMVAAGECGVLEWDGISGRVTRFRNDGSREELNRSENADAMYSRQLDAFLSASRASHDRRLATADDGIRALEVCDAARRANLSRQLEAVTL